MRRIVAAAASLLLSSCIGTPSASSAPTTTSVPPSATPSAAITSGPGGTPSVVPTAAASPTSAPASAGVVAEAGILFFSDYFPPDASGLSRRELYRYDGATGKLTSYGGGDFALLSATGIAHDSAAGVYLQGMNGRWDLMHWDGTRARDEEFTACQVRSGYFASWCTVTRGGVGVGWGSHTGHVCGAPQFVRFPGDAAGRPISSDMCVISAWANDDGRVVVAIAFVPSSATPPCTGELIEEDGACYRRETWIIPTPGAARPLSIPDLPGFVGAFTVSPDGAFAVADHLGGLFMIDLATGRATHLGIDSGWEPSWSKDGQVAFVRGSGRETWADRTVIVAATDGSMREVRGYPTGNGVPSSLAPVWDPTGKRLAWIASPTSAVRSEDAARDYLLGQGVGDRRVLVGDLDGDQREVRCGEGVAEGVRWSHDGTALLLLCRRPGLRTNAFDLWFHPLDPAGARAVPLVRGLTLGGVDANGNTPSLGRNTAWSRGLTVAAP